MADDGRQNRSDRSGFGRDLAATFQTRRSRTLGRVLLAEDDPAIRRLILTMLRRGGLAVDAVADGAQARDLLIEHRYRVLITDLNMPETSGWDLITWLGENPDRRPSSVIVITASDRSVLGALDARMVNAILVKPFDVSSLAAYVRACAERVGPDRRRQRVLKTI